ncbi:brix domain protein [Gregarina niphandrodes]|uniref:Brix domain protein n=1 Tax=Gregarina niphandrodes TaxID=110365 RepID=A0A023B6I7_GRENI|nr:brix domain protein [Gregarina niphandrodes]EZG66566.1 brix domain protein [Gregarina niphandrodes]|eukprot:XP_011130599.1 brix domain protein [Gregarina niphandrodes]
MAKKSRSGSRKEESVLTRQAQKRQWLKEREAYREEKKRINRVQRGLRKEAEARGEKVERQVPRTVESMRDLDDEVVLDDDVAFEDVLDAEKVDEFQSYFSGASGQPKILMTTIVRPGRPMLKLLKELQVVFPESYYVDRRKYVLAEDLVKFATDRGFTDLMIFEQRQGEPHGVFLTHLPEGPTSHFRLSGVVLARTLKGVNATNHNPEIILHNFSTAVARRLKRQLHSLIPRKPEFIGRRVIAFVNKHDFIFFRHYRYVFEDGGTTARLAEIGPRFTLKLRSLQEGILDRECGKFEWFWRPKLQETAKQHHL